MLNQSKLKMLARMIMRPVKSEICPPAMKGKAVLTAPPSTRKDRRAYKHMTPVPRFLRCLREVLGDEEDEQLVTYEKELVQGCYNRHPAREETYSLLHACCTPAARLLQAYLLELDY
jgi:hypothetical protein